MSPLNEAEIRNQFRAYLSSDSPPPDVHFSCERCRQDGRPERAIGFIRRGARSKSEPNFVGGDFKKGVLFRLEPACRYHLRKGVAAHLRVDYAKGRQVLWSRFRQGLVSKVMEE